MLRDITTIVFDVLGTLVDEPGGLRMAIEEAGVAPRDSDELLGIWQRHIEGEQRRIARGERDYVDSGILDREAATRVAQAAGITDAATIDRLATATKRLPAWPDSREGVARLAARFPVLGLSNANPESLRALGEHAGLRWHGAISADAVEAYKPSPRVYRLAVEEAGGGDPERVLMVAAHAWDLRGAGAAGMRTAYVPRPVGDPPAETDAFDGRFSSLAELAEALD